MVIYYTDVLNKLKKKTERTEKEHRILLKLTDWRMVEFDNDLQKIVDKLGK